MTSIEQRDVQSVLAGIDDLLPLIAKRAQSAEELRRLPDETINELDEVGFFKLLQPEQWGGLQCDPTAFYEAVRRIASACGSTGWVSSIIGVHNWHLALFDQQAQDEVWGSDPTVRVSSSYAPMGAGTVVDGGYLVSGAWQWSSGCDHATWAFLGGPVIKDGRPVDFGSFLIPRSDYRIDDVWNVVGLKGTGSNTVVVKDVFVPRHRFLSYRAMNDGTAGGYENNTAPVYKMPWGTMHPTTITCADHGDGLRRLRRARRAPGQAGARGVRRREVQGRPVRQDPDRRGRQRHRRRLASADRQRRVTSTQLLQAGQDIPFELRASARRDQVRATARAIASIDLLFEASGATALNLDQPVQRFWRDAHAGRVHAANEPERAYLIFGNDAFGLPPQDTMV